MPVAAVLVPDDERRTLYVMKGLSPPQRGSMLRSSLELGPASTLDHGGVSTPTRTGSKEPCPLMTRPSRSPKPPSG